MCLSTSKNSKLWLKSRQENALKFSVPIKVENTNQKHLISIVKVMGFVNSLQCHIHLNKMEFLRGRAEHVECARSMLQGKSLSNVFWDESINTVVYLKNTSPTTCLDV